MRNLRLSTSFLRLALFACALCAASVSLPQERNGKALAAKEHMLREQAVSLEPGSTASLPRSDCRQVTTTSEDIMSPRRVVTSRTTCVPR